MPSTDSATDSRITPLAWLFLALSALWCIVWLIHGWHYWEDDAFIHLEFARSVSRGQGFSFNGHVVNGDTSPLWVYLLVAFHRIIPAYTRPATIPTIQCCPCINPKATEDSPMESKVTAEKGTESNSRFTNRRAR